MGKIRILVIEDNRLLRDGLVSTLNEQRDMKVVAALGGHENILLKARAVRPQVILIDLGLRNQNGVTITRSLRRELPGIKVIGMGLIPTQADVVEFVHAGAAGFILKNATLKNFLSTIRSVAAGEHVLPPSLTGSLFHQVIEHALGNGKKLVPNAVRMTKREREIIALIADGLSNKEIAQRLSIATFTVKSHVHNILEKLALHSRLQISKHSHEQMID
jgi:DNA-binding NarL/FixJ family response regulator